jgi:hypothetical protein
MLILFPRIGLRKTRRQARSRPQIERLEWRDLPAPLTWTAGPNLLAAVGGVSASPEAGEIAVFGGGSNAVNSVGVANPSWHTTAGSFASNEFGGTSPGVGILPDYSLMVFGGNSGGAISDAVKYDYYNSDNTTVLASMTTPRASFGYATDSNHLIYAIGGIDDNNNPLSSIEAYTQSTNTWRLLASLPQTLYGQSAAFDGNGHIFTFGGVGANGAITSNVYEYSLSTNTWTTATSMPIAVRDSAAILGSNGLLYVLGGITTSGTTASVESYNPATNSWNTESPLPNPVSDEGAVNDSLGRIEVLGGHDASGNPLANVWVSQQLNQPDSAPTITTTPPSAIAWTGYPNNYQVFSTANPQATYSLTTAPSGMTINSITGLITWYPAQAQIAGTYTVTVMASNIAGQGTQTYNLTVKQSPPTVPSGIFQSGETVDSGTLSWNASYGPIGVDHYNIYHYYGTGHSGRGGGITYHYDLVGTSTTPSFTITGLLSGYSAWYTITAVDANGLSSGYSSIYTVHTLPDTVPPTLTLPHNQTLTATSPSGATDPGAFTATATDPGPGIDHITIVYAVGLNQIPTTYVFPVGTTTVTAIAEDMYGNYTSGNFTITVNSSFPVLTLPPNQIVEQTSAAGATDSNAFTATATDPQDSIKSITYAVNGTQIDPTYVFAPGTTTVTVTATDTSGYSTTGTFTVLVEDIPPTLTLSGLPANNTVTEGTIVNVTAKGTAGTAAENAAGLTFTWNVSKLHNGVTTNNFASGSGTGSSDAISFVADDEGTYTLTVTAADVNGARTTTTQVITSNPVGPTTAISGPSDGVAYQARQFTFTASSPSPVDQSNPFTYTINWGDGDTQTVTGNSSVVVGHAYTAAGNYTVSAYAKDQGGYIGSTATQAVTIKTIEIQNDTAGRGGIKGLAIGGTGGNDNFVISTGSTSGTVSVTLNGVNLGTFTPTGGGIDVYDSPGTSSVTFKAPSGAGTYFLNGQTLTYSNTGTGVPHFKLSLYAVPAIGQLIIMGGNTASSYTIQDATIATSITTGSGNDTFTLADMAAATQPVRINGGRGTNTLRGANIANTWNLSGSNKGTINGTVTFTAFANLIGGTAGNDFVFSDGQGVTGRITGGGTSGNKLDYSAYSTGIYVNLHSGVATGTAGISNIQQVHGGNGNDILLGYGSDIVLQAGAGNDLIIGGSGLASIQSGSGQDIVIAGSTSYDTNAAALHAIEAYWSNTGIDETTRYNRLSTMGTPTGGYKLTPATVKHAAASDTLALGSGNDWVFWRKVGTSDLDTVTGTPEFSTFL